MALSPTLLPGTYKGIPFIVESLTTEGGQKIVVKEFINSDDQSIEELGKRPRRLTVEATITEPLYAVSRLLLLKKLEEGGTGILTLPFAGFSENMKLLEPYRLRENLKRVGEAQLTMVFGASATDGRPNSLLKTLNLIITAASAVKSLVSTDIGSLFSVTSSSSGNFTAAQSKVNDIATALEDNSRALAKIPDKINDFNSSLDDLTENVNTLIQAPTELASTLENLFDEFPGLFDSPTDQTNTLALFFDFGDDDIEINPTTAGLIERDRNNAILNNAVKSYAVAQAYSSASQIEFTTVAEIDSIANRLEDAFQSIKSQVGLGDMSLSNTTINEMEDLRTATQQFFDDQKLSVRQIITVNTPELPARIIAFQYYDSSELGAEIAQLNNEINVSNLQGDIEIFTA